MTLNCIFILLRGYERRIETRTNFGDQFASGRCWNKGIERNSRSTMIHGLAQDTADLASSHRHLPTGRLNEYSDHFASGKGTSARRSRHRHVSNRTKG